MSYLAIQASFLGSHDDDQIQVGVSLPGQLDVNVEVGHDFPDACALAADDHGVDPVIDAHFLFGHRVKLVHNLEDRVLGLFRVGFVSVETGKKTRRLIDCKHIFCVEMMSMETQVRLIKSQF